MGVVARLAAAVVLTAAAGVVLPAAPATAATCSSADGVTVVVDFHELGGGVQTVCDPDGGGEAASRLFPDAGFPLTYVQRQPGFVCRVSGVPSAEDEPCVNTPPTDAYWGLWWSDGESGSWTYSSEGAAALNVPDGGSVAFSWNDSTTKSPPGVAPPTHEDEQPSPSPTTQPSGQTGGGSGGSGGGGTGGGATAAPSVPSSSPTGTDGPGEEESNDPQPGRGKASGGPGRNRSQDQDREKGTGKRSDGSGKAGAGQEPTESATASTDATLTAEPPTDAGEDGLPTWVAPVGIAGLFGVAGVVALLRRRSLP